MLPDELHMLYVVGRASKGEQSISGRFLVVFIIMVQGEDLIQGVQAETRH